MSDNILWMLIGICVTCYTAGIASTIVFIVIWNSICEHRNAKNKPKHARGK